METSSTHTYEDLVSLTAAAVLHKYIHTHTNTQMKMQAKLIIGVIQFLLLTALCDWKINPATKLIYLFFITLSVAHSLLVADWILI